MFGLLPMGMFEGGRKMDLSNMEVIDVILAYILFPLVILWAFEIWYETYKRFK